MTNTPHLFCCKGRQLVTGSQSCVRSSWLSPVIVDPDSAAEAFPGWLKSLRPVLESWNGSVFHQRTPKCFTAASVPIEPLLGPYMIFPGLCSPLLPVEPLPVLSHQGSSYSRAFAPDGSSVFSLFPPVHLSSCPSVQLIRYHPAFFSTRSQLTSWVRLTYHPLHKPESHTLSSSAPLFNFARTLSTS